LTLANKIHTWQRQAVPVKWKSESHKAIPATALLQGFWKNSEYIAHSTAALTIGTTRTAKAPKPTLCLKDSLPFPQTTVPGTLNFTKLARTLASLRTSERC